MSSTLLFFETQGNPSSPAITFIHGFPFTHDLWNPQVEELKKDFYTITYDVRGHGQSPVGDALYSIELFVDDLIHLLDHLGIKQTLLCGLSMGGYIALRALERYPERFNGLILCATRSEADTDEAKLKRFRSMELVKKPGGLKAFTEPFIQSAVSSTTWIHKPEVVACVRQMMVQTSPLAVAGTLLALAARTNTTPVLEHIQIPTLILVGEEDTVTPPALSQAMHIKLKSSTLDIIPMAGHLLNLEEPVVVNRSLRSFLQKNFFLSK